MNPVSSILHPESCDPSTPAGASPASTPDTGATATGARTASRRQPGPGGTKLYTLRSATEQPLPKRALAKLRKLFKAKQRAADAYEDIRELEAALMPPDRTDGILRPGVVYRLPEMMTIGAGKKGPRRAGAIRFTDNFAGQLKASRSCVIPRYELDTWVSGPKDAEGGAE